jgi:hypothetical protein
MYCCRQSTLLWWQVLVPLTMWICFHVSMLRPCCCRLPEQMSSNETHKFGTRKDQSLIGLQRCENLNPCEGPRSVLRLQQRKVKHFPLSFSRLRQDSPCSAAIKIVYISCFALCTLHALSISYTL